LICVRDKLVFDKLVFFR